MVIEGDERKLTNFENDTCLKQNSLDQPYSTKSKRFQDSCGLHGVEADNYVVEETVGYTERWFPTGFKHELKELYTFSWPLVLTTLLNLLMGVTSTMFSGQLGPIELDAVSMGVSIANLIGASIGIGLIVACDTLFAQSYGSANKKQVGIYLQTAIYICSLSCLLSWALLINANYILLVCGQNPAVAKATEEFLFYFMPALFFLFLVRLLQKYLQVQDIIMPVIVIGIIANIINIGLQYALLHVLRWGVKGSAIGLSISHVILGIMTISYVLATKTHNETWGGWSRLAFDDWGGFMKLGLSSVLMVCLEWWTYEVSAVLTGILGETELGASSITYQIWMMYSSLPLGIGCGVAFRIGRYLGEKRPEAALTLTRVTCLATVVLSIVSGLVTLALNQQLPYLFSKDQKIVDLTRELLLIMAAFITLACCKSLFGGIIRGTGRQVEGGVVAFVAFVILAMPIGIPLMFFTSLRAAGFWWGMVVGLLFASVTLYVIVYNTDWHKEAKKAQIRAKLELDETSGLLGHLGYVPGNNTSYTERLAEQSTPTVSAHYWRDIVIQKAVITTACLGVLVFGVICRWFIFIPPEVPQEHLLNTTTTTATNSTITMQVRRKTSQTNALRESITLTRS